MTALAQYERLEAAGRYLSDNGETPVIITFGDASLVVMDGEETPLTHWPLATLRRRDEAGAALILTPDEGSAERLLIDDPQMIEAIRIVCEELDATRPKPIPRWRRPLIGAVCGLIAALIAFVFVPPVLRDRFVETIPQAAERAMGAGMAEEYAGLFSAAKVPAFCRSEAGEAALKQLENRFRGGDVGALTSLQVINAPDDRITALPGGWVILHLGAINAAQSPEALSSALAVEIAHSESGDPLRLTLQGLGPLGLMQLLRGVAGDDELAAAFIASRRSGYSADAQVTAVMDASRLLGDIKLPTAPLADRLRSDGQTELAASVASSDRIGDGPFDPALTDQDWVALAGICD